MNKTAILIFGAFNPITHAHIALAGRAYRNYKEADIWYIPANSNYIKDKMENESFLTDDERLNTVRQVAEDYGYHVSDIEMKGIVDGKAYNTVQYFKDILGYEKIFICLGSDNLEKLHRWYRAEDLTRENEFIIVEREGYFPFPKTKEFHCRYEPKLPYDRTYISSTEVRNCYKTKQWKLLKKMVPSVVYNLLMEKDKKEINNDTSRPQSDENKTCCVD